MPQDVYRSSDGSAPVLDGQAGSLITVLDAVLVNGYGSKTAAGWTKPFSGTNTATYRQGSGPQFYLHVNDNGPGAGLGREARVFGSETASAVLTGTSLFPTVAQAANGNFLRKSATNDATTRGWKIFADDRTFYFLADTGDLGGSYLGFFFGSIYSFVPSDTGGVSITGRLAENSNNTTTFETFEHITVASSTNLTGHYIARNIAGSSVSLAHGKMGCYNGFTYMRGDLAGGNPSDNNFYIHPIFLTGNDGGNTRRGLYPGFYQLMNAPTAVSDGDVFTGTGDLSGRSFEIVKAGGNGGIYVFETSQWLRN